MIVRDSATKIDDEMPLANGHELSPQARHPSCFRAVATRQRTEGFNSSTTNSRRVSKLPSDFRRSKKEGRETGVELGPLSCPGSRFSVP